MNATRFFAAVGLGLMALSATVQAQDVTPDERDTFVSQKTRAQVQAELTQARADGSLRFLSTGHIDRTPGAFSREQVRAELALARANGELARLNSEAPDVAAPTRRDTAVAGTRR